MRLVKLSREEAKKMIDEGGECYYLVMSHDLEKDKSLGNRRINNSGCKILVTNSQTIILNEDQENEDSFSILSLYTSLQSDIFNIKPHGIKHDMIFPTQFIE